MNNVELSILVKVGETASQGGLEHLLNMDAQDENRSILKLHANHHHGGADVRFIMKVTGLHIVLSLCNAQCQ